MRADEEVSDADGRTSLLERYSLERWLRRNLRSQSAVRKLAAGAVKAVVEISVSIALAQLTLLVFQIAMGGVPTDLFAVLPPKLTVGGLFFGLYYYGGIKDRLGPNQTQP